MALTPESALRKDKRTGKDHMQHRHFATVAAILANAPDFTKGNSGNPTRAHRKLCEYFADELAGTNQNFNRGRFLAACGIKETS